MLSRKHINMHMSSVLRINVPIMLLIHTCIHTYIYACKCQKTFIDHKIMKIENDNVFTSIDYMK